MHIICSNKISLEIHITFDLLKLNTESVAHYTLQAKSCVFAGQKMKRIAKFLLSFSFALQNTRLNRVKYSVLHFQKFAHKYLQLDKLEFVFIR